jgi:hypothetical protein
VVKHNIGEYVKGDASTNTAESYFALLKRGFTALFITFQNNIQTDIAKNFNSAGIIERLMTGNRP